MRRRLAAAVEGDVAEARRVDARRLVPVIEVLVVEREEVHRESDLLIADADDRGRVEERRGAVATERDSRVPHERRASAGGGGAVVPLGARGQRREGGGEDRREEGEGGAFPRHGPSLIRDAHAGRRMLDAAECSPREAPTIRG